MVGGGRGTRAAGLGGFLSRHRIRYDNQRAPGEKRYVTSMTEGKGEKKHVANVHAHINHIRFLYIRLFIFLPRCFWSIWRTGKGILREARKKQRM